MHKQSRGAAFIALALILVLMPNAAFAYSGVLQTTPLELGESQSQESAAIDNSNETVAADDEEALATVQETVSQEFEEIAEAEQKKANDVAVRTEKLKTYEAVQRDKLLSYDAADIKEIGSQEKSGHNTCCPSYACAYADAVLDGTVHEHSYYTCACCTWTDWGGGESSFRDVGNDEQLLREAYDQIASGKPTVVHVTWSGGEHWIALIGYHDVEDPDHLTLANFIALDPWDGAQIEADSKYSLYGDGCEHISDR